MKAWSVLLASLMSCACAAGDPPESPKSEPAVHQTTVSAEDACSELPEASASWGLDGSDLRKLCELEHWQSCTVLGWNLRTGNNGFPRDEETAVSFLDCACSKQNPGGCHAMATLYVRGVAVEKDSRRAAQLFGSMCENGVAESCTSLGALHEEGVVLGSPDPETAAEFYQRACAIEDAECAALGYLMDRGLGVVQDLEGALQLYDQSCAAGSETGCNNLGVAFERGEGRPRDYAQAFELYERACSPEYAPACINLGLMYQNGRGTPRDLRNAALAYKRGCESWLEKKRTEACMRLAYLDEEAKLGLLAWEVSGEYLKRACDEGLMHGCGGMARHVLNENPPDVDSAISYSEKACTLGLAAGCRAVDKLKNLSK